MKKKNAIRIFAMVMMCMMITESMTGCGKKEYATSDMAQPDLNYEAGAEYENAPEDAPAAMEYAEAPAENSSKQSMRSPYVECEDSIMEKNWNPNEEYASVAESGFKTVEKEPLSTFSADVDTASYANIRRMIQDGYRRSEIPQDAVRIEEMINYFDYGYAQPRNGKPFSANVEIGDCPWNKDAKLMMVGMQTKELNQKDSVPSNLVFLLDVSGSMYAEDKLPLLQKAFSMLASNLTKKDRVSIVTYAGSNEILLDGVKGNEYDLIIQTLESLSPGGSTAGSAGIITAYEIAEKNFIEGGNNRVILATDGDLNVGLTTEDELEKLITKEKESDVFLSVLGFGKGNIKDNKMELLADKGNGNYSYIDSIKEARKVLVEEMGATLVTVAKDVKFQVEFNPNVVESYRLIGYDNRVLEAQDFEDDRKDAGEVGAGHSVTVLYEIITKDRKEKKGSIDLKYQDEDYYYNETDDIRNDEWLTVSVRYKEPDENTSKLLDFAIDDSAYNEVNSNNFKFASAVAEFGMLLKDSEYKGNSSIRQVKKILDQTNLGEDEYKEEFVYLVEQMR